MLIRGYSECTVCSGAVLIQQFWAGAQIYFSQWLIYTLCIAMHMTVQLVYWWKKGMPAVMFIVVLFQPSSVSRSSVPKLSELPLCLLSRQLPSMLTAIQSNKATRSHLFSISWQFEVTRTTATIGRVQLYANVQNVVTTKGNADTWFRVCGWNFALYLDESNFTDTFIE